LVDEFQRFNGVPENQISSGLSKTQRALKLLKSVYKFQPEILVCSDFMKTAEYREVLGNIAERISCFGLEDKLLNTVPIKYRASKNATEYALNEIACVEFLKKIKGIEIKIGPSKEKVYDEIMRELTLGIEFQYIIDAYAFGTKEPEEVIHYLPNHRGKSGQRIFLDEYLYKSESKLLLGPELALKYLLRVASVAGHQLDKDYLTEEEINKIYGPKLKKTTRRLVLENILVPYNEAVKNEN